MTSGNIWSQARGVKIKERQMSVFLSFGKQSVAWEGCVKMPQAKGSVYFRDSVSAGDSGQGDRPGPGLGLLGPLGPGQLP